MWLLEAAGNLTKNSKPQDSDYNVLFQNHYYHRKELKTSQEQISLKEILRESGRILKRLPVPTTHPEMKQMQLFHIQFSPFYL